MVKFRVVSGYAHVFILLSVVIVTLPLKQAMGGTCAQTREINRLN